MNQCPDFSEHNTTKVKPHFWSRNVSAKEKKCCWSNACRTCQLGCELHSKGEVIEQAWQIFTSRQLFCSQRKEQQWIANSRQGTNYNINYKKNADHVQLEKADQMSWEMNLVVWALCMCVCICAIRHSFDAALLVSIACLLYTLKGREVCFGSRLMFAIKK